MNYWIFQSNVDQQDLRTRLQEGKEDTRLASRYRQQMSEGDLVFFWLSGSERIRGIYGWGMLSASPELSEEGQYRVRVRYHKRLNNHLAVKKMKRRSELKDLLIFRQPQATNFILSREEAQAIAALMAPEDRPHIPPIPSELVESIRAGECVLFAGAGLSARAGVPTWNQFLSGLLSLASEKQVVDPLRAESFAAALQEGERNAVADGLVDAFGTDRGSLQQFLLKTFPELQDLSSAHKLIRQIPFGAVVTTNYDTLLERTFPQFAEAGLYTPKDAESLLDALSQKRRFILKLYGIIQRPETLILAPIEYQEMVSSNVSFYKFVEGLFFSRSFFFIGLSLEGIQDFLSGFVFRGANPRKHFALVAVSGTVWKAKADLLERRFNVRVIDYPVSKSFPEFDTFLEALCKNAALPVSAHGEPERVPTAIQGIQRVILEDIGSFERLELDFAKDKWKILLGDNGVGKSTVLKAIAAAIIGSDARSYAGRLVRAGRTRGRITVFTERNPHGYITDILTKDMLSDSEVISIPSRCMEAEGWLALGFSPLRCVTWIASAGPQPIVQKGRPTADDLIPLLSGEADPRMDRLKQWIINLDAAVGNAAG
jgi:SIR2-like domain/EVE domain/AAA domain